MSPHETFETFYALVNKSSSGTKTVLTITKLVHITQYDVFAENPPSH